MVEIADRIAGLSDRLHGAPDAVAVREVFEEHASSSFVRDFLRTELGEIARSSEHIVRRSAGQASFTLINTADFEYTIRLALPSHGQQTRLKWLGERQIVRFRGPGSVSLRVLRAPAHININDFRPGVQLEESPIRVLGDGGIAEVADGHGLIEIVSIDQAMIIEFVTAHARGVELYWTFDEARISVYAELAALSASRLQNIIEVAHKMGKAIPDPIYDRLVADRNTQTRLLAIQSMLVEQHPEAFRHLHDAIESDNPVLAMGSSAVFDALTKGAEQAGAA